MAQEFKIRKTWKSLDEQINILKSRGMIFEDEENAKSLLSAFGYYRLSGYWFPFKTFEKNPNGKVIKVHDFFSNNSFFEDAILLYSFDKKLRDILFSSLEVIETAIKMEIAYCLGKYDIHAHYRHKFFEPSFIEDKKSEDGKVEPSKYSKWLKKYKSSVYRSRRMDFVKHNRRYGKLPIWIAVELWDFGSMSVLYSYLHQDYKNEISKKFGLDGKTLSSWIRCMNYVRNSCAHHTRVWNNNVTERARSNNIGFLEKTDNNRIFYYINIIEYLIQKLNIDCSLNREISSLIKDFPNIRNNSVTVNDIGINEKDTSTLICF